MYQALIAPTRGCAAGAESSLKSSFSALDILIQYQVPSLESPQINLSPPARSVSRLEEHDLRLLISTDQMSEFEKSWCMLQDSRRHSLGQTHPNPSHWPLRTMGLMDVDRPRLPPGLHRTEYPASYLQPFEKKNTNTKHHRKLTHKTHAHAPIPPLPSEQAPSPKTTLDKQRAAIGSRTHFTNGCAKSRSSLLLRVASQEQTATGATATSR